MSDINPLAAAVEAPVAQTSPAEPVKIGTYSYFCGNFLDNPTKIAELQSIIQQSVLHSTVVNNSVLGAQFDPKFGNMTIGNVLAVCDICKDALEPLEKVDPTTLTTLLQRMFLNMFDSQIVEIVKQNKCNYKNYKHMVEQKIESVRKDEYTREDVRFFYIEGLVPKERNYAPGVDIALQESDNAPWHTNPNIPVVNLDGSSIDPASRDASHHRFRFPSPGIEVEKPKAYLDSIGHVAIESMKYVFVSDPTANASTSILIAEVANALQGQPPYVQLIDGDCITSITFTAQAAQIVGCNRLILVRKTVQGTRQRASFTHKVTIIEDLQSALVVDPNDKCVGNPVKNRSNDLILFYVKYFGDEQQSVGQQIFQHVLQLLRVPWRLCIFTVDVTVGTRSLAMRNAYFVHNHGKNFKDEAGYEIKLQEFLHKNKSNTMGVVKDEANQISTVNSILCIPEILTTQVIHKRLIDRIKREYSENANNVFNSLTRAQLVNKIYLGMRGNEHIQLTTGTKAYIFITAIKTIIETLIKFIHLENFPWPQGITDYQEMKNFILFFEIKRIVLPRYSAGEKGISASNSEKKLFMGTLDQLKTVPGLVESLNSQFSAELFTKCSVYAGGFSTTLQRISK